MTREFIELSEHVLHLTLRLMTGIAYEPYTFAAAEPG